MMLMFRLGRADVLPVDDLGIRKGAQEVDRLEAIPTPKELAARGESWGPYRTYASLYLWRIADTRSEEQTSELQSLMRNSYAVFCWKKKPQRVKPTIAAISPTHIREHKIMQ